MPTNVSSAGGCVPFDEWPACDRHAWQRGMAPQSPFEKDTWRGAKLASSTQKLIAEGYGCYLRWLQTNGLLDLNAAPASRTSEQNLAGYLDHLRSANSPYTVAARLQQLGNAMRIMDPDSNYAVILRAAYRLRAEAKPSRNKDRRVQSTDRTADLGFALLEQARSATYLTPVMRAKIFRDGLLILFLTYRAIRNGNLASIEIGKQLHLQEDTIWLRFEATEMKGRREFEVPVPDELVPHILTYIKDFRPTLLGCSKRDAQPGTALWISSHGTKMSQAAIAYQVRKRTKAAFGASMTPHFFRDSLATTHADEAPDLILDASTLLHHSGPRPVEKHYNQSNGIKARRRHDDAISQWRSSQVDQYGIFLIEVTKHEGEMDSE